MPASSWTHTMTPCLNESLEGLHYCDHDLFGMLADAGSYQQLDSEDGHYLGYKIQDGLKLGVQIGVVAQEEHDSRST